MFANDLNRRFVILVIDHAQGGEKLRDRDLGQSRHGKVFVPHDRRDALRLQHRFEVTYLRVVPFAEKLFHLVKSKVFPLVYPTRPLPTISNSFLERFTCFYAHRA